MKTTKAFLVAIAILIGICSGSPVSAQVTVTGAVGGNGTYTSLRGAFNAINGTTQTNANIVVQITANTTETATAALNAGAWTTLKIYPTVTGRTITGNFAAPLINLNGADNVTINGSLNGTGSTPDLTLINTNTGGSTIQFIADACTNTIKYCNIQGISTSTTRGTILFSTGTATGNDGNTIDRCNIYNGASTPYNGIYSAGTTTSASYYNSGNTISSNNIYNFSNLTGQDAGIYLSSGNTDWTISGNSLYQTATRTSTTAGTDDGICIDGGSYLGNNFTVTGNFIGGSAPQCGGTPWTELGTTVSSSFDGIRLLVGSTTASNLNGNRIANITWNSNGGHFTGLSLAAGLINAGTSGAGNIIGSESGSTSIQIIPTTSSSTSYGIWIGSSASVSIRYNKVSSITVGSTSIGHNFYGIRNEGTSSPLTIDQNTIGSTDGSSSITTAACNSTSSCFLAGISNGGAVTSIAITNNTIANLNNAYVPTIAYSGSLVQGIFSYYGINTITGNTIFNLTTAGNATGAAGNASVVGLKMVSTTAGSTIQQNTIYGLSNTHASAATAVTGIYYAGATTGTNVVARNSVYGLNISSSSTSAEMRGIDFASGLATVKNNMVCLGYDASGSAITSGISMTGIYDAACTANSGIYFNSVYIGGTGVNTTAGSTYAFRSATTTNARIFENNIFVNARSNASTGGKHYAVTVAGTVANPAGLTLNYNDYVASGTGGVFGYFNSADRTSLSDWQTATGQDANSVSSDPQFIAPTAATPDLHINATSITPIEGAGVVVASVTDDFDGETRSVLTPTDIGADAGNFLAPVEVWKSGAKQAGYSTLQAAFAAINSGTHTGTLDVKINGSTTETGTAVLNASNGTAPNYTSVKIYPTVTGLTISGNLSAPLIDLNGADNVTIDGSVGGTGSGPADLTIINTNTSITAGTSTIRFIADASNNTVKYCNLKGSATASATASGIVFFSTGTATGNLNNTITNNNMTNAGGNRPVNAVYSAGSSSSILNNGLVISDNKIYDFLNAGIASNGINLAANTTSCTISGNSFYETSAFTPTMSVAYRAILLAAGDGYTIDNNQIGGNATSCSGTWTKNIGTANNFYAIYKSSTATTNVSYFTNNKITGFSWTNTGNEDWVGINTASSDSIKSNVIGSDTGTGSIRVVNTTAGAWVRGIVSNGSASTINGNKIGSITADGSATYGNDFVGINSVGGVVTNNLVGSTDALGSIQCPNTNSGNSWQLMWGIKIDGSSRVTNNKVMNLYNGSTSTVSLAALTGILYTGTGNIDIINNQVEVLTTPSKNTAIGSSGSVQGISAYGSNFTGKILISTNTVKGLKNTSTGHVRGISYTNVTTGSVTDIIKNNFVYLPSDTGTGIVYGIDLYEGGTSTVVTSNNIVCLGVGSATDNILVGIYDRGNTSGNTSMVYFNTVYIGGSLTSGTNQSYALYGTYVANTRDFRNNIFYNARNTNGGSNLHYAAYFIYSSNTNLTLDYNDYYASGTGGVIGYFNSTNYATLATFKASTNLDANSLNLNPSFVNAGGSYLLTTDFVPATPCYLAAAAGTGITSDYAGLSRSTSVPTMGAKEVTTIIPPVEVWQNGGSKLQRYSNLQKAFNAINVGTHTGALDIKIIGNTTEAAMDTLYQSGYTGTGGASSYTAVNIYPTAAGLSISGALTSPLIKLNGAGNVTIDGRVNATSGNPASLNIINTSTNASASAINFAGASNNIVKYCVLKGSSASASSGVVTFTTGTSAGNSGNWLDSNSITNAGGIRPYNAVYSYIATTYTNTNDSITNCYFYDHLNLANTSNGIYLNTGSTGWTLRNNSFYETTSTFTPTSSVEYYVIKVMVGDGYIIDNNYIGGNSPLCIGTWTKNTGATNKFNAIFKSSSSAANVNWIKNNTVSNFSWTNTGAGEFNGINTISASDSIKTNVIGSKTVASSITLTNGANVNDFHGICALGGIINDNTIGGITTANSGGFGTNLIGIYANGTLSGTMSITNNTIGNSLSNSLYASTNSSSYQQVVRGIYINASGASPIYIRNNTLQNFTNNSTYSSSHVQGCYLGTASTYSEFSNNTIQNLLTNGYGSGTGISCGLFVNSGSTSVDILNNTISGLTSNNTGAGSLSGIQTWTIGSPLRIRNNNINTLTNKGTGTTWGIYGQAGTASAITGNTIKDINNTSTGNTIGIYANGGSTTTESISSNFISMPSNAGGTGIAYGIYLQAGVNIAFNNIVSMGAGNSVDNTLVGIYDYGNTASNNTSVYFNTVYIGGSLTSGTRPSYCLYGTYANNVRNFRNNIFYNARSTTGGSNLHYAAYLNYVANTNLTLDYNDYYVTGAGGVIGYYNSTNYATLADFKGATSLDTHSKSQSPNFINAGGSYDVADDFTPGLPCYLTGVAGTGITTDYFGTITRSTFVPAMGAIEIATVLPTLIIQIP